MTLATPRLSMWFQGSIRMLPKAIAQISHGVISGLWGLLGFATQTRRLGLRTGNSLVGLNFSIPHWTKQET